MSSGSISAPNIIPLRVEKSQRAPIDTNTLIEIRCNTHDVDIYYTLDGSKPDSFITLTTSRPTLQYVKPFCIPRENVKGGKVTVKAIAVASGGIRESPISAKTFDIRIVPVDHAESDEFDNRYIQELQQERQELMRRIRDENEQIQQKLNESTRRTAIDSYVQENLYYQSQTNGIKHPTDLIRCAHCFTPKPNNSYTQFCTSCGLPWQKLTNNPPESYLSKICANCKSTIPFKSDACVVCETPTSLEPQRRPTTPNQTKVICPQCKSGNPIHLRTCYICESVLLPTSTPEKRAAVSVATPPIQTGALVACPKCYRLNNSGARFCDWCGTSPERQPVPIQCTKCRATNDPFAKFCSTCGCVLEPPLTVVDTRVKYDSTIPASAMIASTLTGHTVKPTWLNANASLSYYRQPTTAAKGDAATQTNGIYYPSAKDLDLLLKQNKQILEKQEINEYRGVLKPSSPGKGYWRQQIDHVYAHLKAYANNRPDFQALIGEPYMGKMTHATVHETEHQITLQVVFNRPETVARASFYADEQKEYYPMERERDIPFSSSIYSDVEYIREKPKQMRPKHRPKKRPQSANAPTSDNPNRELIQLLERKSADYRKKTLHHIDVLYEVQRLLKDKDCDVNAKNRDGYTALQLAVRNGHFDCLETLIVDGKAKLDKKGPGGNTVLHECCLLGRDGIEPLRILFEHGGDETWMNDKNENVVDIASKQNCPELLQVIAKHRADKTIHRSVKVAYDDYGKAKSMDDYRSFRKS